MSSSDKIVYAPRAESGHANTRKVRSTWPKVIATESRDQAVIPALDSSRSPSASCDELNARCAFPRFRLSTRKLLLFELKNSRKETTMYSLISAPLLLRISLLKV